MNRLARENSDDLDVLLILNPFELCPGYDPPARPLGGLRMAAVVYDFIPFLDQEHYLDQPGNADWFYRRLHSISRYDHLLAISDATRDDARRLLALEEHRIANISGASNASYFFPNRTLPPSRRDRSAIRGLGIRRPFVFCVAGADERKNVRGLIDAFRRLPDALRCQHQLVITCHLKPEDRAKILSLGDQHGLGDALILTGEVSDETLRTLYQRCAAFAFPSLYEGLGLPLLEAMHCGAAVLAGNNSSQIEVVGDAGLLVNATDPADIASGLTQLLMDHQLASRLSRRAITRASEFTWDRSACRVLEALCPDGFPKRKLRVDRAHDRRPRLALVSPWRPKKSGISTYAAWLAGELSRHYRIDLYHDEGYVPDLGLSQNGFSTFDYRLFDRMAKARDYRGVLYQMGNSPYHGFMIDMMAAHPGIVTLHDFSLGGFQYWNAHRSSDPVSAFRREVLFAEPDRAPEILENLEHWRTERGGVQDALTRRGIHLNRRVFESSSTVIVHSPWCVKQVDSDYSQKIRVIPHGAWPARVSRDIRRQTRARFGLDQESLIFASFGFLSHGKMNLEAIRAFSQIATEFPQAMYLFVGQDYEDGEARREVERLGLASRVRFVGHQTDKEFEALIASVDIGVSLRRPPTYGETSGALLNLLRHGVATIITDVATFADYPNDVVAKVRWHHEGMPSLTAMMRELAADSRRREALGYAAHHYVENNHSWPLVAAKYREVIESQATLRQGSISGSDRGVDFSKRSVRMEAMS